MAFALAAGVGFFAAPGYGWGQNIIIVPTIRTIAGTGSCGVGTDGILATQSKIDCAQEVAVDKAGNVYIDDFLSSRVRRVDAITGIITTVAGTGTSGYNGDHIQATTAKLSSPEGLSIDASGNLFVADKSNCRIREIVATTQLIVTVAGNGTCGFKGDNGVATSAEINNPTGVAIDSSGNLYIADEGSNRIRKVTFATGIIATVVGNGSVGYNGDNILATSASLQMPFGVRLDPRGNIYFSDEAGFRIRRVDASTSLITTVAANGTQGYTGDGGLATSAEINTTSSQGVAEGASLDVDAADNIYIADKYNQRIRIVNAATGTIYTSAGNGTQGFTGDGKPAIFAELNRPQKIYFLQKTGDYLESEFNGGVVRQVTAKLPGFPATAIGSSSAVVYLYVETTAAVQISSISIPAAQGAAVGTIQRIPQEFTIGAITGCTVGSTVTTPADTVCTIPLTFTPSYTGERATSVQIVTSTGTASFPLAAYGTGAQVILSPGTTSSLAGTGASGFSGDAAAATAALLNLPLKSVIDYAGNLYIADTLNNCIRKVVVGKGVITTVAGNGSSCATPTAACGDGGLATAANLNAPSGIALDGLGRIFVADTGDNRIRLVDPVTGLISTFAGTGTAAYSGDQGPASSAALNAPGGVAADAFGNLFIADTGNNAIRRVDTGTSYISTAAGTGVACNSPTVACGDGGAATSANLNSPHSVAVNATDTLYIADTGDNRIRAVLQSTGIITTMVGTGAASFSGDTGPAISADLYAPGDAAVDTAGNIYIADTGNNAIRFVDSASQTIRTIAGSATVCANSTSACGDGSASTSAQFNSPGGVSLDALDNVYVADTSDNRIRKVSVSPPALAFATTPVGATSVDSPKTISVFSTGSTAVTFPVPATGSDPSISSGFLVTGGSTCPYVTTSSSVGLLAAGAACTYAISFAPNQVGNVSGSVIVKDNNLSTSYTTQAVSLSAAGTVAPVTSSDTAAGTGTYGAASSSVTVTIPYAGATAPAGAITVNGPASTVTRIAASTCTGSAGFLTCVVTLTSSTLPAGANALTIVQAADTNYSGSTGTGTLMLSKAAATSGDTARGSGTYASPTSSVIVSIPYGGASAPTGAVTVNGPGGVTATVPAATCTASASVLSCSVSLPSITLPAGANALTISQSTDTNYVGSTGSGTLTMLKATSIPVLGASTLSSTYGNPITFTASFPAAATGSVTFRSGSMTLGTVTISAGSAAYTTSALGVGSFAISASYGGDVNYNPATSISLAETIVRASVLIGSITSSNPSIYGDLVLLTVTFTGVSATPSGTAILKDDATILSSLTLNGKGVATYASAALGVGSHSLSITYNGDANYQ